MDLGRPERQPTAEQLSSEATRNQDMQSTGQREARAVTGTRHPLTTGGRTTLEKACGFGGVGDEGSVPKHVSKGMRDRVPHSTQHTAGMQTATVKGAY